MVSVVSCSAHGQCLKHLSSNSQLSSHGSSVDILLKSSSRHLINSLAKHASDLQAAQVHSQQPTFLPRLSLMVNSSCTCLDGHVHGSQTVTNSCRMLHTSLPAILRLFLDRDEEFHLLTFLSLRSTFSSATAANGVYNGGKLGMDLNVVNFNYFPNCQI